MKPSSSQPAPQDGLFKTRLADLIDPEHKLCRLAQLNDWKLLKQQVSPHFGGLGVPALPVRLVAELVYLQHAYSVSDEAVVEYWLESLYWQYFCGEAFFRHEFPCHPTSLSK